MATMTIRKLDPELKSRLRVRAAQHGRSMEEEVRNILRLALLAEPLQQESLYSFIRDQVEPLGGIDLQLPLREPIKAPIKLDL